jgi:uncharacterized membrane protein required for colicin V production
MWYDLLMLAILGFTTIRGAAKGMAWQLAAIAALVLCFAFATPLSLVVAPAINLDPPLNRWVAMLGIYLAFSFGCFSIARLLRGWLEAVKFTEYDRHLGALFGFVKGATLCLVITFFAVCLSETACHAIMKTRSGYVAGEVLEQLAIVMPVELRTVLHPHLVHFDEDHHVAADSNSSADDNDRHAHADADPWSDRDGDSFRGSVRPENDPLDETDPRTPDNDERPVASDDSTSSRSVVGRAVDAIQGRLAAGVRSWIGNALNPQAPPPERHPDRSSRPDAPLHRADSQQRPSASAETLPALVESVSGLFSTNPQKQTEHREQIEALLNGIPNPVAAAALRDWRADLLGSATDPDPETDAGTPLDRRLLRQMTVARRSLDDLPRPLRDRLLQAERE